MKIQTFYKSASVRVFLSDRDPCKRYAVQYRAHIWRFKTLQQAIDCAKSFDPDAVFASL